MTPTALHRAAAALGLSLLLAGSAWADDAATSGYIRTRPPPGQERQVSRPGGVSPG